MKNASVEETNKIKNIYKVNSKSDGKNCWQSMQQESCEVIAWGSSSQATALVFKFIQFLYFLI